MKNYWENNIKNMLDERYITALRSLRLMDENFSDSDQLTAGWLHDFVCPKCTTLMNFDVAEHGVSPDKKFWCPNCKTEASGQKYFEAWVYQYRRYFAENLDNVIICAYAGEDKAVDFLKKYIGFYAANYKQFPVHGQHAGKGKIMAQSLDEAVWGIYVLKAIYSCRNFFDVELLEKWYEELFAPMAELLLPQVKNYNNISVWIQSCIGMIGLVFDKKDLVDTALNGEYGLYQQLEKGLTNDFLWYEGSLHYHYYMLEGLTYFCEIYADFEPKSKMLLLLDKMYQAPVGLLYENYRILSLNDGWYPLTLKTYAKQIIKAASICKSKSLLDQVSVIRNYFPKIFDEPQMLLYEKRKDVEITYLFDKHIAVLKKPFPVILKSGSCVANHMHRDNLSVLVPPFSVDLGTPGYGSKINDSWYKTSLAHNTISIDGDQPRKLISTTISETDDGIEATAADWPGIKSIKRCLSVDGNAVKDSMEIMAGKEHIYEWTFHCEGVATHNFEETVVDGLGKGHELFSDVRKIKFENDFNVIYTYSEGRKLLITVPYVPEMEIYTAMTPGNPANHARNTLLLRMKGTNAKFEVQYSVEQINDKELQKNSAIEGLRKKNRLLEHELRIAKRGWAKRR